MKTKIFASIIVLVGLACMLFFLFSKDKAPASWQINSIESVEGPSLPSGGIRITANIQYSGKKPDFGIKCKLYFEGYESEGMVGESVTNPPGDLVNKEEDVSRYIKYIGATISDDSIRPSFIVYPEELRWLRIQRKVSKDGFAKEPKEPIIFEAVLTAPDFPQLSIRSEPKVTHNKSGLEQPATPTPSP